MLKAEVYPLLFSFRDLVYGNGFVAGVTTAGQGIMVHEGDAWWMYGVRPGAIAETAASPQETHARFRKAFTAVLFDIASECADYCDFEERVKRFFDETDGEDEARWEQAVEDFRSGRAIAEPPFTSLPQMPAASERSVTVERLDAAFMYASATCNVLDEYATAA